ncbi:MAG: polysaccharide lyase family protein [Planctomycetaceae bacterium]|nr:polysaccharide lyase family protein [Planctomycetaceae bacterium]
MKQITALFFAVLIIVGTSSYANYANGTEKDVVFCIGTPDAFCSEFALVKEGYAAYPKKFPNNINYEVGKSNPKDDWAFVHPSKLDVWAGGTGIYPFNIKFNLAEVNTAGTYCFVIGYCATIADRQPDIKVSVNGTALPVQKPKAVGADQVVFNPRRKGNPASLLFSISAELLKQGENTISIVLENSSWILYDYVALRKENKPLVITARPEANLFAEFNKGDNAPMSGIKKIVFTTRTQTGEHWYANIGYYASTEHVGDNPPAPNQGGKLCVLDLETKQVEVLIDDTRGVVRDTCVHYDGDRILFSWKKTGSDYFHLYETTYSSGGRNVRQITSGEYDDIEPVYTPEDKIIFVSTRAKRWVQCWLTQVAILYGCDLDGSNIRPLSGNIEHDNTPWFLPNGQVLYMRWEYVDRSQVHYHHLWTMNPDGTRQMVFFGNMHPGVVYIDAKPIPNSSKVVASFSWGHGAVEHAGAVGIIDPRNGPDDLQSATAITHESNYRDPWAFSENAFMAAQNDTIQLISADGDTQTLWQIPKEWQEQVEGGKVIREKSEVRTKLSNMLVHDPRPLVSRQRERIVESMTDPEKDYGDMTLVDVYHGRNMEGVKKGDIKKLLVIETLPMPIHYTGGMEPMSYGGTFTLERVVGTVPVDPDGSARFKLPANRAFFFVAMDENNLSVKRMQSFLSVMPGESFTCNGCHEGRLETPRRGGKFPTAGQRKADDINTFFGQLPLVSSRGDKTTLPDVIDYPRDIQPIWDKHCVSCHNPDKREGRFNLSGGRGPMYSISYSNLMSGTHSALENEKYGKETLVADGRNKPLGNYPPRTLGSSASAIYTKYCQKGHYGVELSEREKMLVILWLETGAAYLGTYAGLGSGMLGGYAINTLDRSDLEWAETKAMQETMKNNCASCHTGEMQLPLSVSDEIRHTWWIYPNGPNDSRRKYSRHLFFDLTQPEKSALLLAPLSKEHGGYGFCNMQPNATPAIPDKNSETYKTILAGIERAKLQLDTVKRFDMPDFIPRWEYLREMKRFGILPKDFDIHSKTPVDYYDLEQRYWRSLW